jgi:hypothetical protein
LVIFLVVFLGLESALPKSTQKNDEQEKNEETETCDVLSFFWYNFFNMDISCLLGGVFELPLPRNAQKRKKSLLGWFLESQIKYTSSLVDFFGVPLWAVCIMRLCAPWLSFYSAPKKAHPVMP